MRIRRLNLGINTKKYLNNSTWLIADKVVRILVGFSVGIWMARYLGPESFGVFSYVLVYSAVLGGVAKLGLDGIVLKELLAKPERVAEILGTAFWLKVASVAPIILITMILLPLLEESSEVKIYIYNSGVNSISRF